MDGMIDLLRELGMASLGSFWIPLTVWTGTVLLILGLFRFWHSAHPVVHYAIRLALLLALPAGLIMAPLIDLPQGSWWIGDMMTSPSPVPNDGLNANPSPLEEEISSSDFPLEGWLPVFGFLSIVAFGLALGTLGKTIRDLLLLLRIRRQLIGRPAPEKIGEKVERQARFHGIRRPIRTVITEMNVPPMTFGWRRPVLVIPEPLLDDAAALHMIINHELVHIGRFDYLFQKAELLIGSLFAVDPLVGRLRRSITFYREVSCDAAVLALPEINRSGYAALLVRFAAVNDPVLRPFLGMATSQPELTRRIIEMKHAQRDTGGFFSTGRIALILSAVLLGTITFLVACTDTIGPQTDNLAREDEIFVVVEQMPELIGGPAALQENLRYPEMARKAGVEGTVWVNLTVDKSGQVIDAKVFKGIKGIGAGCDEEALRAVRALRFKPGVQNGEAVDVSLVISVKFAREQQPSLEGIYVQEKKIKLEDFQHQDGVVTGQVIGSNTGLPLAGANVVVEGTTLGAATGPNGRFTLLLKDVPDASSMVISYVGYQFARVSLTASPAE